MEIDYIKMHADNLYMEQALAIREESIDRRLLIAREGLRMEGWTDTALKVYTDGTDEDGEPMWCAMIGENLQEGYAGFSIHKRQAKERLLSDIQDPVSQGARSWEVPYKAKAFDLSKIPSMLWTAIVNGARKIQDAFNGE